MITIRQWLTVMLLTILLGGGPAAVAQSPTTGNRADEAKRMKDQGKLEEALKQAKAAVQANDKDARSHYVLAWILIKMGKQGEAVTEFQKALKGGLAGIDAQEAKDALKRLGATIPSVAPPAASAHTSRTTKLPPGAPVSPMTKISKAPTGAPPSKASAQPANPPGAPSVSGKAKSSQAAPASEPESTSAPGGFAKYAPIAGGVLLVLLVIIWVISKRGRGAGRRAGRRGKAPALPEVVSLQSVSFSDHKLDTRNIDLFTHDLQHVGFEMIGDYQIPELDAAPYLRAFVNSSDNSYAIINHISNMKESPWVDIVSPLTGNHFLTTTTAQAVDGLNRPPALHLQQFPKASMEGLLEKHKEMAARLMAEENLQVLSVSAASFVDHFLTVYAEERGRAEGQIQPVVKEAAWTSPGASAEPATVVGDKTVDFDFLLPTIDASASVGSATDPSHEVVAPAPQPETETTTAPPSIELPQLSATPPVVTHEAPPPQPESSSLASRESDTSEISESFATTPPFEATPFDLLTVDKSAAESQTPGATSIVGSSPTATDQPGTPVTVDFSASFDIPEFEAKAFEPPSEVAIESAQSDESRTGATAAADPSSFHVEDLSKPVEAAKTSVDSHDFDFSFTLDDEAEKKRGKDKPA